MKSRAPFQGMLAIVRFNWPFYVAAILVLVGSIVALLMSTNGFVKLVGLLAFAGSGWFLLGSLGVSWWVYDRSDLYRWRWLERAVGNFSDGHGVICHSGFDEVSDEFRQNFPGVKWTVLDHFDAALMTEPSIRRARRCFPPSPETLACKFDRWPLDDESQDRIFGILAIHELRSEAERAAWFREAKRSLKSGGRVIIAEHVRDLANFVSFGPGFLHFHSVAGWRRSWESSGLRLAGTFRVTPWVRIFILEKS